MAVIHFKKGAKNRNYFSQQYRDLFKALSELKNVFLKQTDLEGKINKMELRDEMMQELDKVNETWLKQKWLALNN